MSKKNKNEIKTLLLKMGYLLADKRHRWDIKTKTAFNKAVRQLES